MNSYPINREVCDYFTRQRGGDLPVFRGARYQRGYGLGNLLRGPLRSFVSTLQPGKLLKSAGLRLTTQIPNILGDLVSGKPVKNVLKNVAKTEGLNLVHHGLHNLKQGGKGIKRLSIGYDNRPRKARKKARHTRRRSCPLPGGDIFD